MSKPQKTNKRLYRCADCGNKQYQRPHEMIRRCKVHCTECGSTFLEAVCANTHDEMGERHAARETQKAHIKDESSWRIR